MFSKEYLNALSKVNGFTDKVILKYPITTLASSARDVIAIIDAEALGCDKFEDSGVYELSKFTSVLGMFENPSVAREGNLLKMQEPTRSSVFTLCDLDLLQNYQIPAELITKLDSFPNVAEFDLSSGDLANFKKASSIMSELNALEIKGLNGNTEVFLSFHNRFNSSSNEYRRDFLGTSTKDFDLKLGIENIQKLPNTDYVVKVKYNEEKDAYRVIFVAQNFTILISRLAD